MRPPTKPFPNQPFTTTKFPPTTLSNNPNPSFFTTCPKCGRPSNHSLKHCKIPSTCAFCGSTKHTAKQCDAITDYGVAAADTLPLLEEGSVDLIKFSPSRQRAESPRQLEVNTRRNELESEYQDHQARAMRSTDENSNHSLLDQPIAEWINAPALIDRDRDASPQQSEEEKMVTVPLKLKRRGRKGRPNQYSLTEYLSYGRSDE